MLATGDDAAELDRVEVVLLAAVAALEHATGRPAEDQPVGLAVDGRPLGDDVRDDAGVVVGVDLDGTAGGTADVDRVQPAIPRVDDIHEVAD